MPPLYVLDVNETLLGLVGFLCCQPLRPEACPHREE
jgi:hypothetical protein